MSEKLPKVLQAIAILCLVFAIVTVYNWSQDHEVAQEQATSEEYVVSEETVVQRDVAAETVVALTADTLREYRTEVEIKVEEIAQIQNEYLPYWRKTDMTIDDAVNGMLRLNALLNEAFPKQNMDVCWCDVSIAYGDTEWTGYVLLDGADKIPCLWVGYLPSKDRVVGYVYAEYDGSTKTFINSIRRTTIFGDSLSAYTDDAAMLKKLDPDVDTNIYMDYGMTDYQLIKDVVGILKSNDALPADYHYKLGDNISEFLQIPSEEESVEEDSTEEEANAQ